MFLCSSVFGASLFSYLHSIQHYYCFIYLTPIYISPHLSVFIHCSCLLFTPSSWFRLPSSWSISFNNYFSDSLLLPNFLSFFLKMSLLHSQEKTSSSHQYFLGILILFFVPPGDSPSWCIISFASMIFLLFISEPIFSRYYLFPRGSMCPGL